MSSLIGFKNPQTSHGEENVQIKKGKSNLKAGEKPVVVRKSLQVLQSSADDKHLTRDTQHQKSGKPQKILPSSKPVVVFSDEEGQKQEGGKDECVCQCHQNQESGKQESGKQETQTAEERAMALMGPGEPGIEYWQDLAEQRRLALADALEENEQLHSEIFKLREENENLTEMAEKAEYFANLFKTLTEENEASDAEQNDD